MIPKVNIKVNGPHGRGTTIAIDGVPIEFSVSHAELVLDVNDVNRLTVEHLVHVDEVEVEAVVAFRATITHSNHSRMVGYIYGEGDTPRLAIVNLLSKMS